MSMVNGMSRIAKAAALLGTVISGTGLFAQTHGAFVPTRFTVVDQGTVGKPDVLLIPGLSSSRTVWDAEATKLAPKFRLHLVQVDGFAGQAAGANADSTDLLPAIVEELHGYLASEHMHAEVMGHSLGGLLALMLAAKYPGDVNKMVIVDALPFSSLMYSPEATAENVKPYAEMARAQMQAMHGRAVGGDAADDGSVAVK